MNSIWTQPQRGTSGAPAADQQQQQPTAEEVAVADAIIADVGPGASTSWAAPPVRPPLARNTSQPVPPPAPQAPVQQAVPMTVQQATDSLSLMQLKKMVAEIRQADPVAYDFDYSDMGPHGEEIDEWFSYLMWQYMRLNGIQKTFEWQWSEEYGKGLQWDQVDEKIRRKFVRDAIREIKSGDYRESGIAKMVYLVLGRWGDTATFVSAEDGTKCEASAPQLAAITAGVKLFSARDGPSVLWEVLRDKFDMFWCVFSSRLCRCGLNVTNRSSSDPHHLSHSQLQKAQEELHNLMTILYISVQCCLSDPEELVDTRKKLRMIS